MSFANTTTTHRPSYSALSGPRIAALGKRKPTKWWTTLIDVVGGFRYKGHRADGRVSAMYAGSTIHYREMLKEFRTEDFDYTYMTPENRFTFMGNGITQLEADGGNLGFYLDM